MPYKIRWRGDEGTVETREEVEEFVASIAGEILEAVDIYVCKVDGDGNQIGEDNIPWGIDVELDPDPVADPEATS